MEMFDYLIFCTDMPVNCQFQIILLFLGKQIISLTVGDFFLFIIISYDKLALVQWSRLTRGT